MPKKKTIREEVLERWEKNPPTWNDIFAATEEHISRIERDDARLTRKVEKLTKENKLLKEQMANSSK